MVAESGAGAVVASFVPVVTLNDTRLASDSESEIQSDMALPALEDIPANNIKKNKNVKIGFFKVTLPSLLKKG